LPKTKLLDDALSTSRLFAMVLAKQKGLACGLGFLHGPDTLTMPFRARCVGI